MASDRRDPGEVIEHLAMQEITAQKRAEEEHANHSMLLENLDDAVRIWYAKDGSPVRAEGLTVARSGSEGDTNGYLCIRRDVRERTRADTQPGA